MSQEITQQYAIEDAQEVVNALSGILQASFDVLTIIDEHLEEGKVHLAQEVIQQFYAALEQEQGNLH